MNVEQWKDVPFDTAYQVSDQGRVRSKSRTVPCGPAPGTRAIPGGLLKPFTNRRVGYLQVNLTGHGRYPVHRLVALAHLQRQSEDLVVNHKNGDRTDNRLENLEWVTHSENHLHSYRELGRKGSATGRFSGEHGASKAVIRIDLATGRQKRYEAAIDAVREGFDSGSISRCCCGKSSTHLGYRWKFARAA